MIPGLGFMSMWILLLWLLSPIGGQSSLRVLSRGTSTTKGETPVYYFNTSAYDSGSAFLGGSAYSYYQNGLNAVFQAALTSLERVKGRNTWGNFKIPVLQYLADEAKADNWLTFDENAYQEPYSALNGAVISGLKDDMDLNFTLEPSYFNLTCTGPTFFDLYSPDNSTGRWGGFSKYGTPFIYNNVGGSFVSSSSWTKSGQMNSYMVDTNYNHTANYDHMERADPNPRYTIIYASNYGDGERLTEVIAAYNCTVGKTYIEDDLLCTGKSCRVRRIRLSRRFGPSYGGWPWPTLAAAPYITSLLGWMGTATSLTRGGEYSPIDAYIAGSDIPFKKGQEIRHQNITADQMAKRLQSLVNTGWQLASQSSATAQEPNENLTPLAMISEGVESNSTARSDGVTYELGNTTATTSTTVQIFVVRRVWLTVNIIVSFIVLFCGISGTAFEYKSNCPDIFGFASSMTRDNPNFEHVPGGDKMDEARFMRHVRVQIVDVKPWTEGHITLKDVSTQNMTGNITNIW